MNSVPIGCLWAKMQNSDFLTFGLAIFGWKVRPLYTCEKIKSAQFTCPEVLQNEPGQAL